MTINHRLRRCLAGFGCALVALFWTTDPKAQAGTITGYTVFGANHGTGPGLGAVTIAAVITANPNNDNQGGGAPDDNNISVQTKKFEHLGYIDIEFEVTPSMGVTEYKVSEFVDNDIFPLVDWSEYRLYLGFGVGPAFVLSGAGDGLDFDDPTYDAPPTSTAFSSVTLGEDALEFFGGSHSLGAQLYEFRIDVPDLSQGKFTLRQVPVVPEPSTLALAALSAVGCVAFLRRAA